MGDNKLVFTQFSEGEFCDLIRGIVADELNKLKSSDEEKMISRAEVANLHTPAISVQTVVNWTKQGKLRSYTNGGRRVLYKKSEVMATMQELKKYSHA